MCLLTPDLLQHTYLTRILNSILFIAQYCVVLVYRPEFYFIGLGYYLFKLSDPRILWLLSLFKPLTASFCSPSDRSSLFLIRFSLIFNLIWKDTHCFIRNKELQTDIFLFMLCHHLFIVHRRWSGNKSVINELEMIQKKAAMIRLRMTN